ncbi:MAG: hypothetical protein WDM78_05095 [Puia sp.]
MTREASIPDLDVISKTYAKLREVTITYNFSQKMLGKQNVIKAANISLVGRNLIYFFPSKYKDIDIDQYSQATYGYGAGGTTNATASYTSGLQTPTTRTFGFNLNLTF